MFKWNSCVYVELNLPSLSSTIKQLSGSRQAVVGQSSGICQAVVRQLSGRRRADIVFRILIGKVDLSISFNEKNR